MAQAGFKLMAVITDQLKSTRFTGMLHYALHMQGFLGLGGFGTLAIQIIYVNSVKHGIRLSQDQEFYPPESHWILQREKVQMHDIYIHNSCTNHLCCRGWVAQMTPTAIINLCGVSSWPVAKEEEEKQTRIRSRKATSGY